MNGNYYEISFKMIAIFSLWTICSTFVPFRTWNIDSIFIKELLQIINNNWNHGNFGLTLFFGIPVWNALNLENYNLLNWHKQIIIIYYYQKIIFMPKEEETLTFCFWSNKHSNQWDPHIVIHSVSVWICPLLLCWLKYSIIIISIFQRRFPNNFNYFSL